MVRLALARGLYVSAVCGVRVLRDRWASTAAMPAVPPSDVADRRHCPAGHQAADAGVVPRHASTCPGQERAVQHRAGPAPWDFDQCRLAGSAQTDAGVDRAGPAAISLARTDRGLPTPIFLPVVVSTQVGQSATAFKSCAKKICDRPGMPASSLFSLIRIPSSNV